MRPPTDRRCTATSRTTGKRCGAWAIAGAVVCHYHGGAAPQVKAAAEARVLIALGGNREIEPAEALLEEVHRAAGAVDFIGQHLAQQAPGADDWAAWLRRYNDERDRLARVSAMCLSAGVAERLVELEEAKGRIIAELITAIIDDPTAGLTDDQRQTMRTVAAGHLRALPAAS